MARAWRLWENAQVISLLAPAADAAGRTSAYVSLSNAHKAFILCYINQGNAATILLTPLQAQDSIGTNSKGLTGAAPIAYNLDTDTIPSDVLTILAPALTYTTDVGLKHKLVIFEIDPIESLDMNSQTANASGQFTHFNHLAVSTGPSNAANITSALLILAPIRFAQLNPPTANI